MSDHMYVQVPADFWALLEPAEFDELEIESRSVDQWSSVAHAVLSVGETGLSVTANLVGVYLAREQIGEFVQRAAAWLGFRIHKNGPAAPLLVLTITTGPPGTEVRIEIKSTEGPDGVSVLDTAALTSAIESALDTSADSSD